MSALKPDISIIIPTYNCESFIAETVNSILNQTFKHLELIVVDDGSTDRTRDIVASYGSSVRLLTLTNSGVCVARNHGIQEATGQYICLMDHDDYWFPDKLELQFEEMCKNQEAGLVYNTFIPWLPDAKGVFPEPHSFELASYSSHIDEEYSGWIYHLLLLDCWVLTSTVMIRAEVFNKCGTFDESLPFSEDWDFWLRISREYPFVMLKKPLTLYRQHLQQGNLIARNIDFRTELLYKAVAKWGLCSPDGRCISRHQFRQNILRYHEKYGIQMLLEGNLKLANRSFLKSWLISPFRLISLGYILAGLLGWKPKW